MSRRFCFALDLTSCRGISPSTNVTSQQCGVWGDKDSKTLYITASTSEYRIKLRVPGVRP